MSRHVLIKILEKELTKEHVGFGGVYFIIVSILCSFITVVALTLGYNSQVVAIADNIAYIVSINVTVESYSSHCDEYQGTNLAIPCVTGGTYNPLADFNKMMGDLHLMNSACSSVYIDWDGYSATVQFGGFENRLGSVITPHSQESTIEDN